MKSLYSKHLFKDRISNSEVVQGLEQVMNISINVLLEIPDTNILYPFSSSKQYML